MFVKLKDGFADRYPYTMADLRADYPNISFADNVEDEVLAALNVARIHPQPAPPVTPSFKCVDRAEQGADGIWYQTWDIIELSREEYRVCHEAAAAKVRMLRDSYLADCDWTMIQDTPLSDAERATWRSYRQALRDITISSGFPWSVVWPVAPEVATASIDAPADPQP